MIDKTIGVIPSRNELSSFSDKRTENSKDKKAEFESHFKQLDKKNSGDVQRGKEKSAQSAEDRLSERSEKTKRQDEETDKPGVAKKRKIKLEDTEMVLNGMVSLESVNKTPDSEENLDGLEKTNIEIPALIASPADINNQPVETIAASTELVPEMDLEVAAEVVEPSIAPTAVEDTLATLDAESNSEVLESLNRDELFKKLESMVKPEIGSAKTSESAAVNHAVSAAQLESDPQSDTSSSQQDESFQQSESSEINLNNSAAAGSKVDLGAKDFATVANTANTEKAPATETSDEANLKEILSQARYLVTQGGGEVSVKMSPEGMGEVHLKMMLENGKMTVEMNTQDKNVQKLIQESLSDLKSSLAAHQISVEHVTLNNKISTVQDMQQSGDSRSSSDSGRHANAGENSFAQFQNNGNSARQHQQSRERQASGHEDGIGALPLVQLNDAKKATAHRVYQSHKAQSLNAVA